MINAEKFMKEILETLDCDCEGFGVTEDNEIIMCQANRNCCICQFCEKHFCNHVAKARWLLSEYKEPVKLTRLEYEILKYISDNTKYLYITRDDCNGLFLYGIEPTKGDGCWYGKYYAGMAAFSKLFQFVQWSDEKPTSIKGILENCEVVDDDL